MTLHLHWFPRQTGSVSIVTSIDFAFALISSTNRQRQYCYKYWICICIDFLDKQAASVLLQVLTLHLHWFPRQTDSVSFVTSIDFAFALISSTNRQRQYCYKYWLCIYVENYIEQLESLVMLIIWFILNRQVSVLCLIYILDSG